MNITAMKKSVVLLCLVLSVLSIAPASAQVSQVIVFSIATPNDVEPSMRTLNFPNGAPLPETVERVYDYLDTSRAKDAFLKSMPDASFNSFIDGAPTAVTPSISAPKEDKGTNLASE